MNHSDEAINRIIARARRERLAEEERQFLIQRAVQNATADSSITAALIANHRRQALLTSQRGLAGSITADSLAESYLQRLTTSAASPAAGALTRNLSPELNELRLVRSLAARLGGPSSPIPRGSFPPSAAARTGIGIHQNTALTQFPLSDKLQLTLDSQRVKRPRHEDLLSRTRETMVRKPGKKAKTEQQLQEEKQASVSPHATAPAAVSSAVTTIPVKKRRIVLRQQQRPEFLLPPAEEYRQRSVGVRLDSYRSLWDKLGGAHGKERFQRRVQNGKVPIGVETRQSQKGDTDE